MEHANEQARESWTAGAAAWVEHQALFDSIYTPATDAILRAASVLPDEHVLDVGCGSGTLVAAATEIGARVTGVDISEPMIRAARERVPGATLAVEDAQTADLNALPGAPYDVVVSRFGVMFFDDPVAAFSNIRNASKDGGRMVFACWRSLTLNPTFTLGFEVFDELREPQPEPPGGAPGAMSLDDPERIDSVLSSAGWHDISISAVDFVCDYGVLNGTSGVEERLAVVLATTIGRAAQAELEPRLGPDGWADVVAKVRASLQRQVDGRPTLQHDAAIWLVTARAS